MDLVVLVTGHRVAAVIGELGVEPLVQRGGQRRFLRRVAQLGAAFDGTVVDGQLPRAGRAQPGQPWHVVAMDVRRAGEIAGQELLPDLPQVPAHQLHLRRVGSVARHHLLHAALRTVLGEHVTQKGSLVAPDRLRFDFSHFQPISPAQLAKVEALVNAEIRRNPQAEIHHMGMAEALEFGAMALFGEKYGERVRVLRMGAFSTELCGGTHVRHTGDIGVFKIVSEAGVAAGVRRIEAVTGENALAWFAEQQRRLDTVYDLVGGRGDEAVDKVRQLLERQRRLEREVESFKARAATGATASLADEAQDVDGIKIVAARLEGLDGKALREAMDRIKDRLADAVVVLASAEGGKAALVAGVKGRALGKVKAGELLGHVAAQVGGKGGGRPDMAQGGGQDGPELVAALAGVRDWVAQRLA